MKSFSKILENEMNIPERDLSTAYGQLLARCDSAVESGNIEDELNPNQLQILKKLNEEVSVVNSEDIIEIVSYLQDNDIYSAANVIMKSEYAQQFADSHK